MGAGPRLPCTTLVRDAVTAGRGICACTSLATASASQPRWPGTCTSLARALTSAPGCPPGSCPHPGLRLAGLAGAHSHPDSRLRFCRLAQGRTLVSTGSLVGEVALGLGLWNSEGEQTGLLGASPVLSAVSLLWSPESPPPPPSAELLPFPGAGGGDSIFCWGPPMVMGAPMGAPTVISPRRKFFHLLPIVTQATAWMQNSNTSLPGICFQVRFFPAVTSSDRRGETQ